MRRAPCQELRVSSASSCSTDAADAAAAARGSATGCRGAALAAHNAPRGPRARGGEVSLTLATPEGCSEVTVEVRGEPNSEGVPWNWWLGGVLTTLDTGDKRHWTRTWNCFCITCVHRGRLVTCVPCHQIVNQSFGGLSLLFGRILHQVASQPLTVLQFTLFGGNYIGATFGDANHTREMGNIGGTPNPGWFLIPPLTELTIIKVNEGDIFHKRTIFQKTITRIFNPPALWRKIFQDLECFAHQFIRRGQVARTNGFRDTVFLERNTCGNHIEIFGGNSFLYGHFITSVWKVASAAGSLSRLVTS